MSSVVANGERTGSDVAENLRRAAKLSREMIGTAGFDGYFKRVNGAAQEILGYTSAELQAEPFVHFVHADDRLATERATALTTSWTKCQRAVHQLYNVHLPGKLSLCPRFGQ